MPQTFAGSSNSNPNNHKSAVPRWAVHGYFFDWHAFQPNANSDVN